MNHLVLNDAYQNLDDILIRWQTFENVSQDDMDNLLDIWLDGFSDDSAGDVDYGPGHHFRVDRTIVRTDSAGFTYPFTFVDAGAADAYMVQVHRIYSVLDGLEEV